ncbi:MAG: hypothetical protein KF782_13815 [Labilithrix sp.]|nr:hypothetical protein [Labilithrix sp.]
MKLHFITTAAEAHDPKTGARIYVRREFDGTWSWRVVVSASFGAYRCVGTGQDRSDAGARGSARKCLARHLASRRAA